MFKNFIANVVERKADKFIAGGLGAVVTWAAAYGVPLDAILPDNWTVAIGGGITSILVYVIRNKL